MRRLLLSLAKASAASVRWKGVSVVRAGDMAAVPTDRGPGPGLGSSTLEAGRHVIGYDVIVAGLGAMGGAIACHLAQRGRRVLGLDRYAPPHDRGSSHGGTRIIRQAYFEDPAYVPLVLRAYELWHGLEHETGRRLLTTTGGLVVGSADGELVPGALASAQRHGLAHEVLGPDDVRDRFPALRLPSGQVAVFEDVAGLLDPEAGVAVHLDAAARRGAELRTGVAIEHWSADGARVTVTTRDGTEDADHLVLAPGAWSSALLGDLVPLTVERQFVTWFRPRRRPEWFAPLHLPLFIADRDDDVPVYALPAVGRDGVKVAFHHGGPIVDPAAVPGVREDEIVAVAAAIAPYLPDLGGALSRATTCLYTKTPDQHFVLGAHPHHPAVTLALGFSGHGFKFAPVVGEVVADLVLDGSSRYDLAPFDPHRLTGAGVAPASVDASTAARRAHR